MTMMSPFNVVETYYDSPEGQIYNGSALEVLNDLPGASVQSILTSPPYWQQRDYQVDGQLGLEPTFHEYIDNLCNIFDEAKRVLKDDGTLFINIGDSYAGSCGMGSQMDNRATKGLQVIKQYSRKNGTGVRAKSLVQIPARFAIEMTNRGWILRNSIIWHKPSCMPASAKDRFTVDYETVHFFSKNPGYKFNQQLEPYTAPLDRWGGDTFKADKDSLWDNGTGQNTSRIRDVRPNPEGRNRRCVWSINPQPNSIKHFAAYPPALIIPCIMAGTEKGDVILDMFGGSGTTALTSVKYNRKFIAIDINKDYCEIIAKRVKAETAQLKLF